MNFYAVLGISRDAGDETIRNAYKVLARRYHPDRGAGSSAEKFREVHEAYETLIDPESRRSYDLSLQWAQPSVRVERMVVRRGPFLQEDAGLFGRFPARRPSPILRSSPSFDELSDRWFRSLGDLFSDSEWPS